MPNEINVAKRKTPDFSNIKTFPSTGTCTFTSLYYALVKTVYVYEPQ